MEEVNPQERVFEQVHPGQIVLSTLSSDYVQVPAGEPFEAHISGVEVTKDRKFDSEELEDRLVIRYTLDSDIEGKGQVYTSWYRPSINPKSNMFKMLVAVYQGSIPSPLDVTDLLGRPLRITLTEGVEKNGRNRQYVEAYLKPTATQKRVEPKEVKPEDINIEDIPDAEIDVDALFGEEAGA